MALIVETGAGLETAESYASVAAANAYFTARANAAWTGTDSAKEAALRQATAYVDLVGSQRRWRGRRANQNQALDWPRTGVVDRDDYSVPDNAVPRQIITATIEAALRALSAPLMPDQDRGGMIKFEKVDVIETEYFAGAPAGATYPVIDRLINLLTCGGPNNVELIRG